MVSTLRLGVVVIVALGAAAPTQDAGEADRVKAEATADFEAKLAEIEQRSADVEDLTADFEQRKHTALLREPMISTGTVRVRAGRVLWETRRPRPSSMGIEQTRAIVLYPRQKAAEIYPLHGEMRLLGASPLPQIEALREAFEMTPADATDLVARPPAEAVGIALAPRPGPMRDHIERVRALIDAAIPALVALEIIDVDGDRTVIQFSEIRTNQGLSEADVTLQLADDIEVSYPAGQPEAAPEAVDEGPKR